MDPYDIFTETYAGLARRSARAKTQRRPITQLSNVADGEDAPEIVDLEEEQ